jgi:DnaK suppressor protein
MMVDKNTTDKKMRLRIMAKLADLDEMSGISRHERAAVKLDQTAVGRLSRMDAMQQQAMAEAEERRRQVEMVRLKHALKILDAGEYGFCQNCGLQIPARRLEIDPAAVVCVKCARN